MSYFKDLPSNPDFPSMENEILEWWYKNDIINKYLHRNDNSKNIFSFIDGPITANGPMGVHHARGRTLKDVFQRYKNACGFAQRFQNGFDCQGLWVEVEVEKDEGFNSKKDIQNFGLDKFTNACLNRVSKYSKLQTEQSKRLGMFMDWENSYYTNSKTNNLYIWHFLKIVNEKGWLIKKKSATTWCPRCETGLSQHEEADGYKEINDTSVYLKFKLKNRTNEFVLAWTTTPWTLSANVLLAINTKFEYVKANYNQQTLYLAKQSADRLGINSYQTIDPRSLLNLEYDSLFDIPAQKNIKHFITDWDLVDPVEGTGVVHIAPGCGQEDFELGKKLNSDIIAPLDSRGNFIEGFGQLTGKYAHDVSNLVIDYLKQNNNFFQLETITHRYPHCWRCKTKCLFRLEDSWYIKSEDIRPFMKEAVKKVNWHPKYVGRRMQNWLDTMEDWMISRKRFYGLSLPFYECSCHKLTVIGNLEELKNLAKDPKMVDKLESLHRPWIDDVEIKCPECGKFVKRIPDVGDCWLDAGVVPFSTLKYLDDKKYWQKWFPADLVLEMVEQVRLWFYSMLFFSVTFENIPPYLNVVAHAEVCDEKGERMSKTKKNGIPYDDAVAKMGADAMRWLYCQQKPYTNVNFGYNIADQVKREFFLILWNSYRFFTQHANIENWKPSEIEVNKATNIMDKWILSRLNSTIFSVSKTLDKYSTSQVTKSVESFTSDLSTWYIRRSRERTDNLDILYHCFDSLIRTLAPFTPYLSELIYQNMHNFATPSNMSVHLQDWPLCNKGLIDEKLETEMVAVRNICQMIHSKRQESSQKIRQPLAKAVVSTSHKLNNELISVISEETNVKSIILTDGNNNINVELDTNLNPELIAEGQYRDLARSIQVMRRDAGLTVTDKIKIFAPSWPKEFEKQLLQKTTGISIETSQRLSIEKV